MDSCFRSAVRSVDIPVPSWSLRRRWFSSSASLDVHFSISWPVNSGVGPQSLPNEAHSTRPDRFWYTHAHTYTHVDVHARPERRSHYQASVQLLPSPLSPETAVACNSAAWSILSRRCRWTIHVRFGNEPLIGNCTRDTPSRILSRAVAHRILLGDVTALAWNECASLQHEL